MHIFAPCGRWAGPRRRHSRSCRSYDETGKRVRTKKEITDENGQIRKGCTVIKKGDVYESHLFTTKDERFKSEAFIAEAKEVYTDLINSHISDPEQRLKVFDKNSVYLPTKKIGKNNPKTAEIEADNTARQEWNRTADLALVSGIEKAKILEIKQSEIHDIGAVLGTYSWQKTNIDGTAESTIADSPHPLECKDLLSPPFETTETTATLRFTEDPDTILSVQCWSDEHWGEPATNSEDVTIVGNVLTLKLGGYIYEVTAEWNTENGYGGTASYFIYLKTAD